MWKRTSRNLLSLPNNFQVRFSWFKDFIDRILWHTNEKLHNVQLTSAWSGSQIRRSSWHLRQSHCLFLPSNWPRDWGHLAGRLRRFHWWSRHWAWTQSDQMTGPGWCHRRNIQSLIGRPLGERWIASQGCVSPGCLSQHFFCELLLSSLLTIPTISMETCLESVFELQHSR